ncbi:antitoxin protein [Luteibacter phage vB_LflM-Pluto]|uniref:Antitoxin protein n=1 Tax=Luteibacter phage vB_LflM-Pluto TaxID=2948611 RepID=A0A9E7MTS5_9CAUD|nr:antitoxin protein [Luteibacter phage vB_LflM-Pluto]
MNSAHDMPFEEYTHPGHLLKRKLNEEGVTPHALAMAISVAPTRIYAILNGKREITLQTSLRLGKYFGQSALFWLHRQIDHDLATVGADLRVQRDLAAITPLSEQRAQVQ